LLQMESDFYLKQQRLLARDKWYRRFWVFCGVYTVGFFYCGIILFFIPHWRSLAIMAFFAFILAKFIISKPIYWIYNRQRPYQKWNFVPPSSGFFFSWVNKKPDSMPSTHGASFMAINLVCLAFFPVLGVLGIITTVFTGMARVILGYHYPSDVFAGWFVGLISALLAILWLSPVLFTR
jgi:membrane-associated phospholipid phosphatase